MFDPVMVEQHGLADLRLGDLVAIDDAESSFGWYYRTGSVTIGIICHADSNLAGHGPGVTCLLGSQSGAIEPVVDRGLTGRENLALHGRLWAVKDDQSRRRINELSEALGIEEQLDRPVESYSGGQRRRLEIARALVSAPRVLFLDEPTVGLDPRIRHELLDVIGALRDRAGTTIVLTTHYLDEAERLCDRVAIVHLGEIVALDSPRALLRGLGEQILEFQTHEEPHAVLAALRREHVAGDDAFVIGARVTVPLHGRSASDALAAIERAAAHARDVTTRVPTLDDVYLQRTGADLAEAA